MARSTKFARLSRKLSHRRGVRDPDALAASIGRKNGKKAFQAKAAAGRRRA